MSTSIRRRVFALPFIALLLAILAVFIAPSTVPTSAADPIPFDAGSRVLVLQDGKLLDGRIQGKTSDDPEKLFVAVKGQGSTEIHMTQVFEGSKKGVLTPETATAALGDASIKNSVNSTTTLKVCKDWGTSSCSSGIGYLNAGQNSKVKYGWGDTDGFYVAGEQKVYSLYSSANWNGPEWVKVSGCAGCEKAFKAIFG